MSEYRRHRATLDTVFSNDGSVACLRLAGDWDSSSWRALADLQSLLGRAAPARIVFDVSATTFAGVTLMAFLGRVASESSATVIVCRPTNMVEEIILATDLVHLVTTTHETPPDWIEPKRPRAVPSLDARPL
jgi:hypothetical protein